MRTCQNNSKVLVTFPTTVGTCTSKATTKRKTWRWGNRGESLIVKFYVYLCDECARQWDDAQAEAAAEARMS